jgi:hypothetical protein
LPTHTSNNTSSTTPDTRRTVERLPFHAKPTAVTTEDAERSNIAEKFAEEDVQPTRNAEELAELTRDAERSPPARPNAEEDAEE